MIDKENQHPNLVPQSNIPYAKKIVISSKSHSGKNS